MSVKALGIALKLTFSGMNQLIYPQTWLFTIVVVACIVTQMNYLNKVIVIFHFINGQFDGAYIVSIDYSNYFCATSFFMFCLEVALCWQGCRVYLCLLSAPVEFEG